MKEALDSLVDLVEKDDDDSYKFKFRLEWMQDKQVFKILKDYEVLG